MDASLTGSAVCACRRNSEMKYSLVVQIRTVKGF
ncbi:MAG: hypothetical protein A4E57_04118 [Syntrophorhabdaceae bacterium PtaU1.Bin034]|nr:MAG: hypothetical protein A4E57_04118 [Syntrophorhabdaceae bacterium PtaU1.Bin034]